MNAVLIITVKMPKIDESKKMSSREQLRHRKKKIGTEHDSKILSLDNRMSKNWPNVYIVTEIEE